MVRGMLGFGGVRSVAVFSEGYCGVGDRDDMLVGL